MIKIQPVFLIGAMKSGTTTISKHLELHPEICFPPVKEPDYFSKVVGYKQYKTGDYFSLFKLEAKHRYIFDGSVGYAKYPLEKGVPKRIFDYGLKPKFIYVVRNPFDRIESHYNFMRKDLNWKEDITSNHLINVSNYYLQLEQYKPFFSRNDFLLIDFDDLKEDYKAVVKSVYDFIGIKDYVYSEVAIQNNKTKPVNRYELRILKGLKGKFNFIPKFIRLLVKRVMNKVFRKKTRKLNKKEFEYVNNQLKLDMQKFQREYDFDVTKWGFRCN